MEKEEFKKMLKEVLKDIFLDYYETYRSLGQDTGGFRTFWEYITSIK